MIHQWDRRFATEIDIGFIDDDDRVRIRLEQHLDIGQRQGAAGRRIRVGDDDAAIGLAVIDDADGKGVVERYGPVGHVVQLAIHRIETVGDVGKQDRPRVPEQGHEGVRQHFVRAVADEYLLRGDVAEEVRDGFPQPRTFRIGIELERFADLALQGRQHARARAVGIFVGIELDEVRQLRLLAGDIGLQGADSRAPESAHGRVGRV